MGKKCLVLFLFLPFSLRLVLTCFPLRQIISDVQNQLTPEKANIMISSKRFTDECSQTEPWFQTLYSVTGTCVVFIPREEGWGTIIVGYTGSAARKGSL